jgi:hypothetical protein
MNKENLKGKRFIALVRCSTPGQADTSLDAQEQLAIDFGQRHGMIHVDTVAAAGVTGSVPGVRDDLAELLQRKKERDDFDALVLYDSSRLTRGGVAHGLATEYEFRRAGVQVLFARDSLPGGEMGDAMRGLQYLSAKEWSRMLGATVARGQSAAQREGRAAHCKPPPYGIDRLYVSADGKPRHILRNLADGRQLKLDPQTGAVLETFGRNEKSGAPAHCPRQKTDKVWLVSGDPHDVEIVRAIYRWHFADDWGYPRIAKELNARGEPSPKGRQWCFATIRQILLNPTYRGVGIANRTSCAIYAMRGKGGPVEVQVDEQTLAQGRPPERIRPVDEWFFRDEPALANLLDEPIKAAAAVKQQAHLDTLAAGVGPRRRRDRHRASPYLLKGILRSKPGNLPMTGRTTGPSNGRRRYYVVTRALRTPVRDSIFNRQIPAVPLEAPVVAHLQRVLGAGNHLEALIQSAVAKDVRKAHRGEPYLNARRAERERLKHRLCVALDELDEVGREAARDKLREIQARIRSLDAEIEAAEKAVTSRVDPKELSARAARRLATLADRLHEMPPATVRAVLETFVSSAVVDLETRQVSIELALPPWAELDAALLCLDANSSYKGDNQAQRIVLARLELCRVKRSYVPCDTCRRKRAA